MSEYYAYCGYVRYRNRFGDVAVAVSAKDVAATRNHLDRLRVESRIAAGRIGELNADKRVLLARLAKRRAEWDAALAEARAAIAERDKWRDIAERAFTSALHNAVALADERKEKAGE